MEYTPTIGLEIHAELKTKSKMFCGCRNDPDEKRPNVNVCPVCMGHPGTLPVANKEAVKSVLRIGLALGGRPALEFSEFDRKNYFYPDIPKGYQISQYKNPLVNGGELAGVKITRVHLEEDTARSSHPDDNVGAGEDSSLLDFNRAGVPLMELVTEPVMHSAQEAVKFGQELQLLLQYLGVAQANMEKGEMRLEANVSVVRAGLKDGAAQGQPLPLGTKVEVKNLNSFRAAEKAIEYEIKRQAEVLEGGGKVAQETRGWDEKSQTTFSQRSKEDSHDYRYFPEPDLPKLRLADLEEFQTDSLKKQIPETPAQKRERLKKAHALKESDIEFYVCNRALGDLFEGAAEGVEAASYQLLSNYIVSDVASLGERGLQISADALASVIKMIAAGEVSSRGAKNIISVLAQKGGDPRAIAEQEGLFQKSDESELAGAVKKVVEANQKAVAEYKAGKEAALQFLVGQCMRETKGSANPAVIKGLLLKLL